MVSTQRANGAAIYAARLCTLLQNAGHEVVLAASPQSWIATHLAARVELLPTSFAFLDREALRVAATCRERRIDATHSHASRAHRFGRALSSLTRIPHVAHAHSHHLNLHWLFQRRIIALSQRDARLLRRTYLRRRQQVAVLPNFVESAHFAPHREDATVFAERLGLPPTRQIILCAAAVSPRKGQHLLVRALHQLRPQHPTAHLVLLGRRDPASRYDRHLLALIRALDLNDHVTLTGFRDDVAELLPYAHIAALPSFEEPFALAGLEALAAGLPLIATRVGGFPEMITDGRTGRLIPRNDVPALHHALAELLNDAPLRLRLGTDARRSAEQDFNVESHLARYETILRDWGVDGSATGPHQITAQRDCA